MVVAQDYGLVFKHSWKDHTISHKDSNEYMMSFAADGLHPRETFLDDPKTKTGLVDRSLQRMYENMQLNQKMHCIYKKPKNEQLKDCSLLSGPSTSLGNARGDINIGCGFFQEP